MSNVDLGKLIKDNVRSLKAYSIENVRSEVKLHANESPFPPPKELYDLFAASLKNFPLNRYPDPDSKNLKESIAKRLGTKVDHLVIGNGSDEIILLLLQVFCMEEDTIIIPDPTFAMYAIISQSLGIKTKNIPLNSNWDFNASLLLEAAEKNQFEEQDVEIDFENPDPKDQELFEDVNGLNNEQESPNEGSKN